MKKVLTIILFISVILTGFSPKIFAAEDQFTISQVITGDDTAPSVPTGLSATAVSTSQIDLSWTASTDDAAVTGYQVFRDSVFIATSTAISYSDSGLTPDTTYTYTVTAFDAAVNISAESAPASATTFSISDGSPGGGLVLLLRYLSVSPDLQSAFIQFGTNLPVQATVAWGRTLDYEMGSSGSALYQTDHSVRIDDLSPSTRYYFKIDLTDGHGRQLTIDRQQFTTLSLPDIQPPANVSNFIATPSETAITLTWDNPKADFDIVRIVKSDKFYPRDPLEGEVIYEGRAEKYIDKDVVLDKTYYYTAFSRDRMGNYSSGAVTDGRLLRPGEKPTLPKLFANILQLPKELIHSLLKKFSLADVDFIQDGAKLPVVGNTVEIRGDRNLTISIDYEKVPEILKTIVVTMFDPENPAKTFSFLLRVNADKTAYQANVAALERPGKYEFSLAILDHKHQGLALLAGTIFSKVPELISGNDSNPFDGLGSSFLLLIVALIILLLVLFAILRRRNRKFIYGFQILIIVLTMSFVPVNSNFEIQQAEAALNKEINYQGKLTNSSNVAVTDGSYIMKFRLYTAATGATTTNIWEEIRTATGDKAVVSNGLFSVMLGSSTSLANVDFNQTLYLGVEVCGTVSVAGCDNEMTPRKKLGVVPAAIEADKIDGLTSEEFLRNDAINSTSTATTWLTFTQNGAGDIANFIGPSSAPVLSVQSASSRVSVGTSTAYSRFTVWGGGTGTGQLANFVNNASTSVMTLLDNGNVGIGTTSPVNVLSVAGVNPIFSIYDTSAAKRFSITNAGDVVGFGYANTTFIESDGSSYVSHTAPGSTGYLNFLTNNTEYLRLTSGGLFGVGTTTPNNKIDVYSTTKSAIGFSGASGSTYKWTIGMDVSNGGRFSIASSTALGTLDRFVIDGNGNVGIGVTAPSGRLDVSRSSASSVLNAAIFSNTGTSGSTLVQIAGANGLDATLIAGLKINSSGTFSIQTGGTTINTEGTDRITILSTGNVGIGTSSPYAKLSVVGETVSAYFTATTTTASTFPYASTTALTVSGTGGLQLATGLNGPLQANAGLVSATTSIGVLYGGTGATTFGQGWIYSDGGTSALAASTSPTVNYLTATSTSATSTFAYDASITGRLSVLQSSTLATIIGNTTGAARGTSALDIQSTRSASTQVASGLNAIAFGINNTSSGDYSQTFGYGNSATGFSEDSNSGSIAIGQNNSATGQNSYAFGSLNVASGFTSVAFGRSNTASAAAGSASALGVSNTASGAGSVAVGDSNTSAGLTSSALGYSNIATGDASSIFGYLNKSYTLNSVVFGNRNYTSTGGLASVALGVMNNQTGGTLNFSTGAVTGTATGTATVGSLSSAVGILNTVSANFGQAFGFNNTVSATNASVFGAYITNSQASSTQIGPHDTAKLTVRGDTGYLGFTGIGTTTPNNMLDIYSTTKSAIGFSGASGSTYKWTIGMDVSNGGRFSIASSTALGTLDRFVIDGNGNVGIGTTSPYAKLSVVGPVVAEYFHATSTTATSTLAGGLNVNNGSFIVDYSTGKIGLGTTSPLTAVLNLNSDAGTAASGIQFGSDTNLYRNAANQLKTDDYFNVGANIQLQTTGGIYGSSFNGNLYQASASVTMLFNTRSYTSADNAVEMGTGTWTNSSGAAVTLALLPVYNQTSTASSVALLVNRTDTALGSGTQRFVDFQVSSASKFNVSNAGVTGIATATPWRTLSVTGTVAFDGLTSSGTGNAVCIATTKDITDAGGGTCTPSALRFKENIETLSSGFALDKLNQLRVVSFDYREGAYSPEDSRASYGMIAEEVEEIDPNLVDYGYDGRPLTLKFEKILGLAVQSIQELDARVAALEGGGFAGGSGGSGGGGISSLDFSAVIDGLENLGVRITNGLASFKNLVVETLTIGSAEKPSGITLYDEVTGKPYCVKIANGKLKNVSGKCEDGVDSEDVAPVDENPPVRSSSGSVSATTTVSQSAPVVDGEQGTGPNIETGPGPSDPPGEISTLSEPRTGSEESDVEISSKPESASEPEPEPAPEPEPSPESSG